MIDPEKIIYSINIEDVQNVAEQELDRKLTTKELKLVIISIGMKPSLMQLIQQTSNQKTA
ncbi:MAG: hypothetical protein IT451_01500 [Candidatus Brocadia sp.]|nr:hypothetical protein [Candidatus Brocadia sp.]